MARGEINKKEMFISQSGTVVRRVRGKSKISCAGCVFNDQRLEVSLYKCARKVPEEHVYRDGNALILDCVELLFIYSEVKSDE